MRRFSKSLEYDLTDQSKLNLKVLLQAKLLDGHAVTPILSVTGLKILLHDGFAFCFSLFLNKNEKKISKSWLKTYWFARISMGFKQKNANSPLGLHLSVQSSFDNDYFLTHMNHWWIFSKSFKELFELVLYSTFLSQIFSWNLLWTNTEQVL